MLSKATYLKYRIMYFIFIKLLKVLFWFTASWQAYLVGLDRKSEMLPIKFSVYTKIKILIVVGFV